jgi:hypothetical protein
MVIDGRDHQPDSTTVIAGSGTWGVWSTASTLSQAPNSKIGGTVGGVDYAPTTSPSDTAVIRLNQSFTGGFPTSPDSAFGGPSAGFPEGTLKAIAQSGVGGSQYVTDPSLLKYPLSGVTYIEMPNSTPQNKWNAGGGTPLTGTGILAIHNSAHNALADNVSGNFDGIVIGDDISHLHGNIWGAILLLTTNPSGNVLGNGGANIYYSKTAISRATGIFTNGSSLKTLAWWE